ncbi:hypothetical protein C7Y72_04185 [Paraconexibacter algicola]|uniref:Glycosyltransferase 2-like domain-containing protein n=1 Tax=Paraconexibacter algicola TaxID=2133960 RepID=A0A2T4UI39_9ACTN|nr:hypothetical protein C7Y72_04185 [Paraconexibacter algicola]
MRGVTVGVLLPVHGFAPFLAEAIDAVLAQDPAPDVVVVVDDGSPVPVALHPDHLAAGVRRVRRATAGGPAAARDTGLRALDPAVTFVALCDADDTWEPGALAAHLRAHAASPGAGWSFGRSRVVGVDGRPTGERWDEPAPGRHDAAALGRALHAANPVPTSSVVLRREALAAVGGFAAPVRVAEDWELWLRLCAAGHDALCVPDAVVRYRRHPGGLTADVAALARAQLEVRERHVALAAGPDTVARARAADLAALADGLARAGDPRAARAAWARVARERPLTARERARRLALALPGVRARVGRGPAY